jgi:hypothetical protein
MVSPQGYAGRGHLAYYWSPDWGDTWIGHPDNPVLEPGQFPDGVPYYGFQRTPTFLVDNKYHRYIFAYNASINANTEPQRRRTYIAIAQRPDPTNIKWSPQNNSTFWLMSIVSNPSGDMKLVFQIPEAGHLEVSIYSMSGRLLVKVGNGRYGAGRKEVVWDGKAGNWRVPAGVYIVQGTFKAGEQIAGITWGRIVVQ